MKKTLIILLALGLLLCGCGNAQTETTEPAPTLEPVVTEPEAIQPMPETLVVRMEQNRLEGFDESGEIPVITYEWSVPQAWNTEKPEIGRAITEYFADYTQLEEDGTPVGWAEDLETATNRQKWSPEGFNPFFHSRLTDVTRLDEGILSLAEIGASYSGGPHGFGWKLGWTFDARTGELLTLEDLTTDPEAFKTRLVGCMVNAVRADPQKQEQMPWIKPSAYQEKLSKLLRPDTWYLTREGMVIFSQEEELGPHAAGTLEFNIPYDTIRDLMKPEYVPEENTAQGTLELGAPEGCNARIVDDLVLQEGGEILMLAAKGRVENVKLYEVGMGENFYPRKLLWAAALMEDTVLRLETMAPGDMPSLMVTYDTAQGQQTRLLAMSGEDGHYFLMEP